MAVVDKLAGRGAAIRNAINTASAVAAAAAAADRLRSQQAYNPNPVYVAPRAPIATAPATSYTVPKGTSIAPPSTRGTSPSRYVAPPPVNITAQALAAKPRAQTPEPVPAAYKFFGGGQGYDNIENVRAQGQPPIVTPRPAVTPVGPTLTDLLQQQFQDYEAMRVQGGLPETRMGGFGPQYSPEPGVVHRPSWRAPVNQERVPAALKFDPNLGPGYEGIENLRAAQSADLDVRLSNQTQQMLSRITSGFEQDQRRVDTKTDTENYLRRSAEEQEANRLFSVQQEIRQLENQLDSSNRYPIPVDERVLMQQRLNELRQLEQGIFAENAGRRPSVFEQLWTNLGRIGPEDVRPLVESVDDMRVIGGPAGTVASAIGDLVRSRPVEALAEEGYNVLVWWDTNAVRPTKDAIGQAVYEYATGNSQPVGSWWMLNPLASSYAGAVMVVIDLEAQFGDGSLRQQIIDAYENGYGDYTGDAAVWEVIQAQADDLPWWAKLPFAAVGELAADPSSLAGPVGKGGRVVAEVGQTMRAIPEATFAERVLGGALNAGGKVVEHSGSFVDTVGIEQTLRGIRGLAGKVPGPGFTSPSLATQSSESLRDAIENEARGIAATVSARSHGLIPEEAAGFDPTVPPQSTVPSPPPVGPDDYPGGAAQLEADLVTRNAYVVREQLRRANAEDVGRPYTPTPLTPEQQAASARLQEYQAAGGVVDPQPRMGAGAVPQQASPSSTVPQQAAPGSTVPQQPQQAPLGSAADAPTGTASIRDDVADAGRIVDQETGEVLFRGADVPEELGALRRAVDESARLVQAPRRVAGQSFSTPLAGGTFPQDVALQAGVAAVRAGDTAAARSANELLERFEQMMSDAFGGNRFVLDVDEPGKGGVRGQQFSVPTKPTTVDGYGYPVSPSERAVLGGGDNVYGKRNALYRDDYQYALARVKSEFIGNAIWDQYMPGSALPTRADDALRRNADGNFVGEDFRYLADEYILTTDQARADRIMQVLESDVGDHIFAGANGEPYLHRFPKGVKPRSGRMPTMQGEVHNLLRQARKQHQEALAKVQTRNEAARIGGGLGADSKRASEAIVKAEAEEAAKRVEAVSKNYRDTQEFAEKTMKVAADGNIDSVAIQDIAQQLGYGRNLDALTYQQWWNIRGEINRRVAGVVDGAAPAADVPDDFVSRNSGPLGITPTPARVTRFKDRYAAGSAARQRAASSVAAPDIQTESLRYANEIGELDNATATYLDQVIDWTPSGKIPADLRGHEWRVWDAMGWTRMQKILDPEFDEVAEFQKIADAAAHYDPPSALARGIDRLSRTRAVKTYDATMNVVFRQHRRYGPLTFLRNILGDWIGTEWQLAVMGEGVPMWEMRPWNMWTDMQAYVKQWGRDPHRWAESLDNRFLAGTGQLIPKKLMPGVSRGETALGGKPIANEFADKWLGPIGGKVANIWTLPFAKDMLNQIDLTSRRSLWSSQYEWIVRHEGMAAFQKKLLEVAGDAETARLWTEAIEREAIRKVGANPFDGAFSPADVRNALAEFTNKKHDLARAWQSELKRASDNALKRTEKVLFSYRNTNLDEIARRIFVFHYWQSRAIPLHVRATLRNPVLLMSYWKFWQALERAAEEGNMPDYLRGPFTTSAQFMQTPTGITGTVAPLPILLPTTQFDLVDANGQQLQVFTNQMTPMMSASLAVAGLTDNVPNLFGTAQDENFVRRWMNFLRGQGYDVPGLSDTWDLSNTTEDWTSAIINAANQWLQDRGAPVGDFQPFSRGASELDQLRSWVQVMAVSPEFFGPRYGLNGEQLWTAEQMAMYEEALVNIQAGVDGNPLSDAARQQAGIEDGLSAALSLVVPGGSVVYSQGRTDLMDLANRYADKGFTGTPEEHAASDFRQEAKATDPAWVIANQQWHNLGTPEQQAIWDTYWGIVSNPEMFLREQLWGHDAESGDQFEIDARQLLNMTEDQRKAFADQWLAAWPGGEQAIADMQALRDEFKEANPEIADFRTYVSGVYDYEGGPGAFIDMMLGNDPNQPVNPNFKRAYDERREYLESQGKKGAVLEAELEDWATSQDAFFAAMGMQQSIYDDKPLPVYDPSANPYANPQFAGVMDMGPQSTGGNQYSQSDDNKRDKATDSVFEQSIEWTDENNRKQWATSLAEQMYGDAWNEQEGQWETWAYKDKNYRENVLGLPDGNTDYYMDESPPKPGESSNDNRFQEWVLWMQRTNPGIPASELTPMAWAAWETGTWEEYMASINPPAQQYDPLHALWARHLYN